MVTTLPSVTGLLQGGTLRALAVTGDQRMRLAARGADGRRGGRAAGLPRHGLVRDPCAEGHPGRDPHEAGGGDPDRPDDARGGAPVARGGRRARAHGRRGLRSPDPRRAPALGRGDPRCARSPRTERRRPLHGRGDGPAKPEDQLRRKDWRTPMQHRDTTISRGLSLRILATLAGTALLSAPAVHAHEARESPHFSHRRHSPGSRGFRRGSAERSWSIEVGEALLEAGVWAKCGRWVPGAVLRERHCRAPQGHLPRRTASTPSNGSPARQSAVSTPRTALFP